MDIVKKNLVSIISGVLALVCVVLIFFPLGGLYTGLVAEVNKSVETGNAANKVLHESRTWPTLSTNEAERVPLKGFPTSAVIQAGEKITGGWSTATTDFVNSVVKVQQDHLIPLVPGALPGGYGQAVAYRFMTAYRDIMSALLNNPGAMNGIPGGGVPVAPGAAGAPPMDTTPKAILGTVLIGRGPPTADEIKGKGDMDEYVIRRDMPIVINGQVNNQPQVEAEVVKQRQAVGDQLRSDVAKTAMVYVDPSTSFVANEKIVGNTAPAANDIFMAQIGLWLQQEICRAIYDVNMPAIAASKDDKGQTQGVAAAPIKRLIAIRFQLPYVAAIPAAGTPAPTDVPAVPVLPTAKIAQDFIRNPLGQLSNDLYDVLPFNMAIVCDAATLPQVLAGLEKGRYVSIRSIDVQTMDAGVAYAQGYIYGTKPVVQVTIRGQYLMLRKFIGPLMPPDVIRGLSAPAVAGAPAGG